MRKSSWLLVVIMVVLAAQTFAFDGRRHGFVIGGGLGFAPVSRWSVSADSVYFSSKTSESRPGLGANLLIGYAFDEQNMLVYDGNVTAYYTKGSDKSASQGFNGFSWLHYFGRTGHSWFTSAGVGLCVFAVDGAPDFSSDLGLLFGGGYEFARHWQVGGYVGIGKTSWGDLEFHNTHINLLISTVAF